MDENSTMLTLQHLRLNDYGTQPWKNGLGVSRQIAVDTHSPFRWRVSWSEIKTSGPFSDYPGYDRVLTLLGTQSISLSISEGGESMEKEVFPLTPFSFAGEKKVIATTPRPVDDVNLFCRRDFARGAIYAASLKKDEEYHFPYRGQEHFLFVATGAILIQERNAGKEIQLARHETCRLSRKAQEPLLDIRAIGSEPDTSVLWIVIHVSAS